MDSDGQPAPPRLGSPRVTLPEAASLTEEPRVDGEPEGELRAVGDETTAPSSPRFVPEVRPTPLQPYFIGLSVVALVCGAVAITLLNLGSGIRSDLVRAPVLLGGACLALTMADALLRVWRAAWAWMPVDRGKGLFRLTWAAAIVALYGVLILAVWAVLSA